MSEQVVDYTKQCKSLYFPPPTPVCVTIPAFGFIVISGRGDPNGPDFQLAVAALYSLSYAVRMSGKSDAVPAGYYEYKVFPLEGEWDLQDKGKPVADKSNFVYRIMIRQPEFLTPELFERFVTVTKKKKPNVFLDTACFEIVEEGICCQMLHIGSYDEEPCSFGVMDEFCREKGYRRASGTHREIYLSDPRKSEAAKLKTVLRIRVKPD